MAYCDMLNIAVDGLYIQKQCQVLILPSRMGPCGILIYNVGFKATYRPMLIQ